MIALISDKISYMQPNINNDFRSQLGRAAVSAAKVIYVPLSNVFVHCSLYGSLLFVATNNSGYGDFFRFPSFFDYIGMG